MHIHSTSGSGHFHSFPSETVRGTHSFHNSQNNCTIWCGWYLKIKPQHIHCLAKTVNYSLRICLDNVRICFEFISDYHAKSPTLKSKRIFEMNLLELRVFYRCVMRTWDRNDHCIWWLPNHCGFKLTMTVTEFHKYFSLLLPPRIWTMTGMV